MPATTRTILENTTRRAYHNFENRYHLRVPTATGSWDEHALTALRDAGFRSGGARRAVVDYLGRQPCCASAQEIHDGIVTDGGRVGIASVYRVLETLAEQRLVQRVDVGDGVARFEPVLADGHHHHHLVCDDCGRVQPFSDEQLERALERAAERLGYGLAHDVVLRGACGDCR
jgi:Fur family ferric uptake transcriptional regulator